MLDCPYSICFVNVKANSNKRIDAFDFEKRYNRKFNKEIDLKN